ncbi:MAG: SAM-dependent methyltransferase, partial [uncultured Acetobacteraceae bacterium]
GGQSRTDRRVVPAARPCLGRGPREHADRGGLARPLPRPPAPGRRRPRHRVRLRRADRPPPRREEPSGHRRGLVAGDDRHVPGSLAGTGLARRRHADAVARPRLRRPPRLGQLLPPQPPGPAPDVPDLPGARRPRRRPDVHQRPGVRRGDRQLPGRAPLPRQPGRGGVPGAAGGERLQRRGARRRRPDLRRPHGLAGSAESAFGPRRPFWRSGPGHRARLGIERPL